MTERFGIQDHSPQLTQHAQQNPTSPMHYNSSPTPAAFGQTAFAAPGGYPGSAASYAPKEKKVIVAIILAALFGPLGLVYSSFVSMPVMVVAMVAAALYRGGLSDVLSEFAGPVWTVGRIAAIAWTIPATLRFNSKVKAYYEKKKAAADAADPAASADKAS